MANEPQQRRDDEEPLVDTSILNKEHLEQIEQVSEEHGLNKVNKSLQHRSGREAEKGGQNMDRGEPPPPTVVGPGLHGDRKSRYR
jgi:hypothetical protein